MSRIMAIIALVIVIAIGLVGCGDNNNPTSSDSTGSKGGLIVIKDESFDGGTGFPGSGVIQVGSIIVVSDEDMMLTEVVLSDYNIVFLMGETFQNLFLESGYTTGGFLQLGATKNTLNTTSTGKYVFTLSPAKKIMAGVAYYIGVHAEIKSNAMVQPGDIHGIKFYSVTVTDGTNSKKYVRPFELPPVHIYGNQKG